MDGSDDLKTSPTWVLGSCLVCRNVDGLNNLVELQYQLQSLEAILKRRLHTDDLNQAQICESCKEMIIYYCYLHDKIVEVEIAFEERIRQIDEPESLLEFKEEEEGYDIASEILIDKTNEEGIIEKEITYSENVDDIISIRELSVEPVDEKLNVFVKLEEKDFFKCLLCQTKNHFDCESMKLHLKAHRIRIHICEVCGRGFHKKMELGNHQKVHFPDSKAEVFKCIYCPETFESSRLRFIHTRSEHGRASKEWRCTLCPKVLKSQNLLDQHMNIHYGNRPFKCTVCNASFACKYSLSNHVRIHTNRPRSFKCDKCDKAFLIQNHLEHHRMTHTNRKEFVCKICEKAFRTRHNLNVHQLVHTRYKPFMCRSCGKAFARRAEVKAHEIIHTGERPFKCDICDLSFTQRVNMMTHKRIIHNKEHRHKCKKCDLGFRTQRLAEEHHMDVHSLQSICPSDFHADSGSQNRDREISVDGSEDVYVTEVTEYVTRTCSIDKQVGVSGDQKRSFNPINEE